MPDYGYQIGDRVFYDPDGYGTVVSIDDMPPFVGIRFDNDIGGHTCDGLCEDGHGFWILWDALIRVAPGIAPGSFRQGDQVTYIAEGRRQGDTGTVLFVGPNCIAVRFDRWYSSNHDCDGMCEDGHGYYALPKNLVVTSRPSAIDPTEFLTLLGGDSHVVPSR